MTRSLNKIVIVLTTVTDMKSGSSMNKQPTTGFNAVEAGYSWKSLRQLEKQYNMEIVFASPRGGECMMSPKSSEEAKRDFELKEFLESRQVWYENNGVIGAIAQGSIGLVNMKNPRSGEPFLKNRKITCMTSDEEKKLNEDIPFYVEEKLEELGAKLETQSPYQPNVVIEENRLVSGQNPPSARQFGERLRELIMNIKK
ncbi:class I glutamine amidotransferase-like protein [Rozella allomycis CSF55]|uniref:Class I glutamine amidotransferase-like protein n=1 Tax=Rozella allomycis (strain CSF55) TaxID=988480 RepID=A0A075AVJ3_ROZAC|nr:hypothetical protein O9G_003003 [Rozella allomycis CSF55]RKP18116.1 class I glutamine amidotransferase-like protein [Rozella allomycis CSF55]|eukprot:EPZ34283.1 hypothetical protein O9G_003003 [Rozella allomycis CSF55]